MIYTLAKFSYDDDYFYCLFETVDNSKHIKNLNFTIDGIEIDNAEIRIAIKRIIIGDKRLLIKIDERGRYLWNVDYRSSEAEYFYFLNTAHIYAPDVTLEFVDFPDDETAKFWFKLNY
jgi:hypothetical protein